MKQTNFDRTPKPRRTDSEAPRASSRRDLNVAQHVRRTGPSKVQTPFPTMRFIIDPNGPESRKFWATPRCPAAQTSMHGHNLAKEFAAAAGDPSVAMLLPSIIEDMTGLKSGALAGIPAGAFLVELASLASKGINSY